MIDYSKEKDNNDVEEKNKKISIKNIKYNKIILTIILSYGLFYSVLTLGQSNGKLFTQEELFKFFDKEQTALIIGAILAISRIIRVISNIIFYKIYKKIKDKVGILLALFLSTSIVLYVVGYFISDSLIYKFTIMGVAYSIILFVRDPYREYMQDLVLKNANKDNQQILLTLLGLSRNISEAVISLIITAILLKSQMIVIISILAILAIIEVFIATYLYKIIKK